MARGGSRTPRSPAATSGPGRLARRTDGGAGQPVRAASGQAFGQRQAQEQLQGDAPLADGGTPVPPSAPPGGAGVPQAPLPDAFAPTARPTEPVATGLAGGSQILGQDHDALTRLLYQMYPHPDLARLINPYRGP